MCPRSSFSLLLTFVFCALNQLPAQDVTTSLNGHIEGNQYISPTGAFRVTIPVIPALGGSVSDTDNVVTFQDAFSTHQSIACFKMDTTQRFEDETRGRKDYLIWFFSNFVQADFEQRFTGARIESAHYLPSTQSGSLLTYNILPGGSMFAARASVTGIGGAPVAKRGNLVFVKNGYIFVLSIELAEKVLEGSAYNKTLSEEDALLRQRLIDLLGKITFSALPTPNSSDQPAATDKPASPAPADKPVK